MFTVAPEEVSLYNAVLLILHSLLLYSISPYLELFCRTNWIQLSIDEKVFLNCLKKKFLIGLYFFIH